MVLMLFAPTWFYGYDVVLEVLFSIVAFAVAVLAFKVYKKSAQRNAGLFGISFFLIGISYLIQSLLNFLILSRANESICRGLRIQSITAFNNIGVMVHILFMTIGLSMLLYITFRQKETKLLWLLIITSLSAIYFSYNMLYMFYLFSTIFLAFISWHFIQNYRNNSKSRTMVIALAFLFLLFGSFHFLVSVNHQLFYVIGHILELMAYLLILINYYLVLKK